MTNEELYLARKIFLEHLSIPSLSYALPIPKDAKEDGFLLRKDRNPNTKGAELIRLNKTIIQFNLFWILREAAV